MKTIGWLFIVLGGLTLIATDPRIVAGLASVVLGMALLSTGGKP